MSELDGALLDAAVAKALGRRYRIIEMLSQDYRRRFEACVVADYGGGVITPNGVRQLERVTDFEVYAPSTVPNDGHPIIEGEHIELMFKTDDGLWSAYWAPRGDRRYGPELRQQGETALQAATRCFVASRFGEEVEL